MQTTEEIVVGLAGQVYAAPVGTAAPTTVATAWGAGWVDLGYTSENGITMTEAKSLNEKRGWPSPRVLRRWIATRDFNVAFTLIQFNTANLIRALGGGTVTEGTTGGTTPTPTGVFTYEPPTDEELGEFALGVEWQDGADIYRLVVPEGLPGDNVDIPVNRSDSIMLPFNYMATVPGTGVPYSIITNAAAFNAA